MIRRFTKIRVYGTSRNKLDIFLAYLIIYLLLERLIIWIFIYFSNPINNLVVVL